MSFTSYFSTFSSNFLRNENTTRANKEKKYKFERYILYVQFCLYLLTKNSAYRILKREGKIKQKLVKYFSRTIYNLII